MAVIRYEEYGNALTQLTMTPALAGLANGNFSVSDPVDNSTLRKLFVDVQLEITFSVAPNTTNLIELYLIPSLNGTTYADRGVAGGLAPAPHLLISPLTVQNSTSLQTLIWPNIQAKHWFRFTLRNQSGQTITSATLSYRLFTLETV